VKWYLLSPFYDSYLHLAHTIYFFVTVMFFLITCSTGITWLTNSAILTSLDIVCLFILFHMWPNDMSITKKSHFWMMSGKLVTCGHMRFKTSESLRPAFVKGGPAYGICYIILCVFYFHFVNDYESSFFKHICMFYRRHTRFVVITVLLLKVQLFWGVMLSLAQRHSVIPQKVSIFR
jgi:hypothetical protein